MAYAARSKPSNPKPANDAGPQTHTPALSSAMRSNPGRVRQTNEDACAALPGQGAFVVCDGMGGAAAGELASRLAVAAFLESIGAQSPGSPAPASESPALASESPGTSTAVRARLEQAVRSANHTVFRRARSSRELRGMGTTLVAALLQPSEPSAPAAAPVLWVAHVGDSRCYLFRDRTLRQLTQDHSLVEEQIRAGMLRRDQAESSPIRNIITQAIGTHPTVEPGIAAHLVEPGDLFLLASDGLTRELAGSEIESILTRRSGDLDLLCDALIEAANAHGGNDNITVILLAAA